MERSAQFSLQAKPRLATRGDAEDVPVSCLEASGKPRHTKRRCISTSVRNKPTSSRTQQAGREILSHTDARDPASD